MFLDLDLLSTAANSTTINKLLIMKKQRQMSSVTNEIAIAIAPKKISKQQSYHSSSMLLLNNNINPINNKSKMKICSIRKKINYHLSSLVILSVITLTLILDVNSTTTQQVSVITPNLDPHPSASADSIAKSLKKSYQDSDHSWINLNQPQRQHSLNYLLSVISDATSAAGDNIQLHSSENKLNLSDKNDTTNLIRASSLHNLNHLIGDDNHDHSSDKIGITLANDAWKLMRSNAQRFAREKVQESRPIISQLLKLAKVNKDCQNSIYHLLDGLERLDLWAVQMWNAWGDFPAQGLFEGTFTSMGSYYGCVDIKPNDYIGEAQYCTFKYQPVIPKRPRYHNILASIPDLANFTQEQDVFNYLAKKAQYFYYTKLRLATCMPTKCSIFDMESLAKTVGSKATLQYAGIECLKKEPMKLNGPQRFAMTVLISLALVSVLGTLSHVFNIEKYGQEWRYTPALVKRFLSCMMHFSMLRNICKLFDTQTSNRSNDISCIHGLRFWTISWIIFGHTMQYTEWAGFGRAFQIENNLVSFAIQPLLNATFSVDTFFLISGILTTYVTWSMTKGDYRRFNKIAFIISRYLRLTPQVLLVTLIFIIYPLMGDGPYWKGLIQKESEKCQKNWWVNALYLQAFFRSDQICNLVTWWLSIEMFYHLVSVVVIITLLKSRTKGLMLALAMASGFTMVSFYLHYLNHYPPNMLPTLPQRYEIWDSIVRKFFWTPYPHAAAYFTGLVLGFVLYTRCIKKLTTSQVRNGWILFLVCYLSILWGTYGWNKNEPYSRLVSSVYYNTCQVLWALATGWAILACVLGRGGWLNRFLSLPIFIPLGRATYMTYLAHMLIVMSYPASMNLLIEPSYLTFVYIFISNLFFSNALGITLTIVYESPILHLQKLLLSNMASKFEPTQTDDEKDPSKTAALIAIHTDGAADNQQQQQQQTNGNGVNNNNNNNNSMISSANTQTATLVQQQSTA